jgi:hypothetical protein
MKILFFFLGIFRNKALVSYYTTKEFKIPTAKTNKNHSPTPDNTVDLFSDQPFGEAKTTGTPTKSRKERTINANKVNWNTTSMFIISFKMKLGYDEETYILEEKYTKIRN